jgi:hypothetical protein
VLGGNAGDTTPLSDRLASTCHGNAGDREEVWLFTPMTAGTLTIIADELLYDVALSTRSECDAAPTEQVCTDISNPEVIHLDAEVGVPVYVIVEDLAEDGGAPYLLNLSIEPAACGDGALNLAAGEECDDADPWFGFLCASCAISNDVLESEPNDDGAVAVGSDDYAAGGVEGPFLDDVVLVGALSPAGDEDGFAITNAEGFAQTLYLGVTGERVGIPHCEPGFDVDLVLFDDQGGYVDTIEGDDLSLCPFTERVLNAGETLHVLVYDPDDDDAVGLYHLVVVLEPI